MKLPIYLDNHATTRVDQRVIDVMVPLMAEDYGNAASRQHEFGWKAEAAVELARERISALVGATADEIVFTSGATESVNLALKGIAEEYRSKGNHIITAATEHRAVLDTCARLGRYGFEVTMVPVDGQGMVDPDEIRRAIKPETILVSVMAANNEIGTIAPLASIGALCHEHGILFHTDATQAAGKIELAVKAMNIDLLSFSAHKMHGPKGIGALVVRSKDPAVRLAQQIDGGGHEKGRRSGTLNVPGIAGFGKAAEIAAAEMGVESVRVGSLRDSFVDGLGLGVEGMHLNGHRSRRLPQNANVTFAGVSADAIMMAMKDVAVSSGSACSSATPEPSHVLLAIGLSREDALSSIRFGLGRFTTAEEIDYAIARVSETVRAVGRQQRKLVQVQ